MPVCDENMRHRPVADRGEQRIEMAGILRSRIDDGERLAPDEERRRAGEGEGSRIAAHHARDERAQFFGNAVRRGEISLEAEAFGRLWHEASRAKWSGMGEKPFIDASFPRVESRT